MYKKCSALTVVSSMCSIEYTQSYVFFIFDFVFAKKPPSQSRYNQEKRNAESVLVMEKKY
jgi:hypothetical protein